MWYHTLELLRCPVCGPAALLTLRGISSEAEEIIEGALRCQSCERWFRIEGGIADLVRDALREDEADRAFLARHAEALGGRDKIAHLKPFGLDDPAPSRTPEDERILEEGQHWGRFMRRFWDVGDRSIFDLAVRGTHPPFYVAGVIEPDDRDTRRPHGNFSRRASRLIFERFRSFAGKRALDIGCGGGQFGLGAAREGVLVTGFDPSFAELELARHHAREQGIAHIDYVRAEPANPPFATEKFSLLLAKDALHHVPDLDEVLSRLLQLLDAKGRVIIHEHCGRARVKDWLLDRVRPRAIEKIRSRYPKVDIPEELLRDSANENIARDTLRRTLKKHLRRIDSTEDLYFANELELLVHFAYGKRAWVSAPVYPLAMILERLLVLVGERQHLTFVGEPRGRGEP